MKKRKENKERKKKKKKKSGEKKERKKPVPADPLYSVPHARKRHMHACTRT